MSQETKPQSYQPEMPMHSTEFSETLKQEMFLTASTLKTPIDPPMIIGYQEALADLRPDQIRAGFKRARRTLRFFPKPVDVRELSRLEFEDKPLTSGLLEAHEEPMTEEERAELRKLFAETARKLGLNL